MLESVKRVAVIGAGPSGAITLDALVKEGGFNILRVFERNAKIGGTWLWNPEDSPKIPSLRDVIQQKADKPIPLPLKVPCFTPRDERTNSSSQRFSQTGMNDHLESNIDARIMSYTKEPFPDIKTQQSIANFGQDTPFRHREVIRGWIENLFTSQGYQDHVELCTTVELVEKVGDEWVLTLRKATAGGKQNYWWQETFDAVVVASGHYYVPYIPNVPGLEALEEKYPASVQPSKAYRDAEDYRDKKVIVVGSFVSATDVVQELLGVALSPVYASVRGPHPVLGFAAFEHPQIVRKPTIESISTQDGERTVYFSDGSKVENVDSIIYGTGFVFSLPFLPAIKGVNHRVPGLYLHIFKQDDPTLAFVGFVSSAFAFRVFEWQAVAVARVLAGRATLPALEEQMKWEEKRLAIRGDGPSFHTLAPDWAEYFEKLRTIAGEPQAGTTGRVLPRWDPMWITIFEKTWERRLVLYRRNADAARQKLGRTGGKKGGQEALKVQPKL